MECAALHRVLEIAWEIECCDLRRELRADAEMARARGHFVAEADQSRRAAGDGGLVRVRERAHVEVEIARGVEAARDRRADRRFDDDPFQDVEFYDAHVPAAIPRSVRRDDEV